MGQTERDQPGARLQRVVARLVFALLFVQASACDALPDRTQLIGVSVGSDLSPIPAGARWLGYELSTGERVTFRDWYDLQLPELRLEFITEVAPDLGLIWGFGTGERGEKYRIDPSLKIGLLHMWPVGDNGVLSVRLTTRLGGQLHERPCTADYGDIGGVQRVNCRLAATPIEPRETLHYLWDERPGDRLEASVGVSFRF